MADHEVVLHLGLSQFLRALERSLELQVGSETRESLDEALLSAYVAIAGPEGTGHEVLPALRSHLVDSEAWVRRVLGSPVGAASVGEETAASASVVIRRMVLAGTPSEALALLRGVNIEAVEAYEIQAQRDAAERALPGIALGLLIKRAQELRAAIAADDGIGREMKTFLIETLIDLERSAALYPVSGIRGVRDVIDRTVGRLAQDDHLRNDLSSVDYDRPWKRPFFALLRASERLILVAAAGVALGTSPFMPWVDTLPDREIMSCVVESSDADGAGKPLPAGPQLP